MPGDYSLSDVLERMYTNQLALEAALMELTLHVEQKGVPEVGSNIRGALGTIGENAGHIKQGLARFRGSEVQRFRGSEVQRSARDESFRAGPQLIFINHFKNPAPQSLIAVGLPSSRPKPFLN